MFKRAWHWGAWSVHLYATWGPPIGRLCWGIDFWSAEDRWVQTWAQAGPLYVEVDLQRRGRGIEEDA